MPRQIQLHVEEFESVKTFSPSCAAMEALHERARHSTYVVEWLRTTFYIGESGSLSKLQVYKEYLHMCAEKKLSPVKNAILGKLVHRAFPNILSKRRGRRGESRQHYFRLNYIKNDPQQQQPKQKELKDEATTTMRTSAPWTFISSNQNQIVAGKVRNPDSFTLPTCSVSSPLSAKNYYDYSDFKEEQEREKKYRREAKAKAEAIESETEETLGGEESEKELWLLSEERGQESYEQLSPRPFQKTALSSSYLAQSPSPQSSNSTTPPFLSDYYSPPPSTSSYYGQPAYNYNYHYNNHSNHNNYYNTYNTTSLVHTSPHSSYHSNNYYYTTQQQQQHSQQHFTTDNSNLLLCELLWDGEPNAECGGSGSGEGGSKAVTLEDGFKRYYEDLLVAVLLDDPSEIKAVIRRFWVDDITPNCFTRLIGSIVDTKERDRRIIDAERRGIEFIQEHILKYPIGYNKQQENAFLCCVATRLPMFVQEVTSGVVSKEIIIIQLHLWTQFAMKVFGAAQAACGN